MKRISIGFFVLFLASLLFSACQENIYIDWKLANEKWMTNFVAAHKSDSNFYTTASGLSYHLYYAGYRCSSAVCLIWWFIAGWKYDYGC